MSYSQAIARLEALGLELHTRPGEPRRKFELGQMRVLMGALDNPQNNFRSVLVAGTNGKGSTSATLAGILAAAGYHTGLYTSPHLSRINERVCVDREVIADEDFAALFFKVEEASRTLIAAGALPGPPSYFETVTAIAFLYFAVQKVHTAVLEVGMGGRLDATNIVEPLVSIITDISLDHTEWLGSTITEIAREKAGILRPRGVMVTLPQHPQANQALGEAAEKLAVRGVSAVEFMPAQLAGEETGSPGCALPELRNRYSLTVARERIEIDSPLAGAHQQRNLALAMAAAFELRNNHGYILPAAAIAAGIRSTVWPGRLERIAAADGRPEVLLDVGHNPAGAWALRAAISSCYPEQAERLLIFSCLRDKPVGELAQILFPIFSRVIVTPLRSPRAVPVSELLEAGAPTGSQVEAVETPSAALARAFAISSPKGLVVVTGSLYLVGEVREELKRGQGPAEALSA